MLATNAQKDTHTKLSYVTVTSLIALAVLSTARPAHADARIGKFTVTFVEGVFKRSGDFVIPGAVKGVSPDGDFKADRAFGNYQRQDVTLVGHVVIHQHPRQAKTEPLTLTAQQVRIVGKPAIYTATGTVVATQGTRSLHSDYLQLNDATHQGLARGNVSMQEQDRVVSSAEIQYNTLTGAVNVPNEVTGLSSDTDFRADHGSGNQKAGTFRLQGNVVVHRFGNYGGANNSTEPLTLWCDNLDIVRHPETTYTATGHVRVAQGDKTMVAPILRLNDTTHIATMTGGVHGEEPPDRTFDAAELLYNTQTEDFKALGGVKATFPFRRATVGGSPAPSAAAHTATPVASPHPSGVQTQSSLPSPEPTATHS